MGYRKDSSKNRLRYLLPEFSWEKPAVWLHLYPLSQAFTPGHLSLMSWCFPPKETYKCTETKALNSHWRSLKTFWKSPIWFLFLCVHSHFQVLDCLTLGCLLTLFLRICACHNPPFQVLQLWFMSPVWFLTIGFLMTSFPIFSIFPIFLLIIPHSLSYFIKASFLLWVYSHDSSLRAFPGMREKHSSQMAARIPAIIFSVPLCTL